MKTGINFASRPNRAAEISLIGRFLPLALIALISILHLYAALQARAGVRGMERSIEQQEERLAEAERQVQARRSQLASPAAVATLQQFAAQDRSGATGSVSFAEVVSGVAAAFPAAARAHSLTLVSSVEGPLLTVEATGRGAPTASELVERLSGNPIFRSPEILDERLLPTGELRFRVRAGVRLP